MEQKTVIEFRNVTKVFPGVVANKDVSFSVKEGEIHSIVGENGAGKSTLMNILFGLHQPTSGEILLRGKPTKIQSPYHANELGLGMVHQHFMLIENFTVLKNILLGAEPGNQFKIDYDSARKRAMEISETYGLSIEPDAYVRDISVPMQQRTEILKVLWREAEMIIFDEPTAVLTPQEIDEFCEIALRLKSQGKTLLFISHKLAEVMRISDSITVMRHGQVIGTKSVGDTDEQDLVRMMVGHDVVLGGGERNKIDADSPVVRMRDVHYSTQNVERLKGLDLELYPGEILGIAGIDGNGQNEIVDIISGREKATSGEYFFDGANASGYSIAQLKDHGLASIYEDRHKEGLILTFSVKDNTILGYQTEQKFLKKNKGFLNEEAIAENAKVLQKDFDIRCGSLESLAGTLSGGNQQKIIIAREVSAQPKVLMAVQPTRGLDMGAIEFVHTHLVEQRNRGCGVLLLSLELDEIMQLSDRIAVLFNGKIIKVVENKNLSRLQLGRYMLGVLEEEKGAQNG